MVVVAVVRIVGLEVVRVIVAVAVAVTFHCCSGVDIIGADYGGVCGGSRGSSRAGEVNGGMHGGVWQT